MHFAVDMNFCFEWSICCIPIVHLNATDTIRKMKNSNLSIFVYCACTHTCTHMYHHLLRCYRISRSIWFDLFEVHHHFFLLLQPISLFSLPLPYLSHFYVDFFFTRHTPFQSVYLCVIIDCASETNGKTLKTDIRNKNQSAHFLFIFFLLLCAQFLNL